MVNQDKTIDQIYDLFAVRILVDTVKKTAMRHLASSMRCINRFRAGSRTILPMPKPKYVSVSAYDADRPERTAI